MIATLQQQNVLLVGIDGKSGNSVLRFFLRYAIGIHVCDERPFSEISPDTREILTILDEKKLLGRQGYFFQNLDRPSPELIDFDWQLVIISPGVPKKRKFFQLLSNRHISIISEIELAYRLSTSLPLALTGTDGKSTTCKLTSHLLNRMCMEASACGNIGLPYLDIVTKQISGDLPAKHKAVVELSSYQLESVVDFSPLVAAIINIDKDHVDRYDSLNDYILAKMNIMKRANKAVLLRWADISRYPILRQGLEEILSPTLVYLRDAQDMAELIENLKKLDDAHRSPISGCFFYCGQDLFFLHFRDQHDHINNNQDNQDNHGIKANKEAMQIFLKILSDYFLPITHFDEALLLTNNNEINADHANACLSALAMSEAQSLANRNGCRVQVIRQIRRQFTLPGKHNAENLAFGIIMAYNALISNSGADVDIADFDWQNAVKDFEPLEHRFQNLGKYHGIIYINDSKATTLQSMQRAVESLPPKQVILIAGGRGKGVSFASVADDLAPLIKGLVVIGETANEIQVCFKSARPELPIRRALTMQAAVALASEMAGCGDTVLLSPGCASFDMFNSFEHRGQAFIESVVELKSE